MKILKNKEKREFYSLEPILKTNADYFMIYGERSNGKSYAVKDYCLKRFLECGEQFVVIRRYDTEIKRARIESYFSDTKIDVLSNGEFNAIWAWSSELYLVKYDDNGKRVKKEKCGYIKALNTVQSESGTQYPEVQNVILEEFIALDGRYINSELFRFTHIISTIARRRNIKVFMLANSISRISPYWREYGVEEVIKNQEMGTICLIERQTDSGDIQRVAVEYCANTLGRSRMFGGERGAMINEGKWLTTEQPKLMREREEYESLYQFVVQYKNYMFFVEYLIYDTECLLYVTPKTTHIKGGTRVISDRANGSPLYTYGLVPLNQKEREIFAMITNGKVFYADNQTGTEFLECIKNIKKLYL